MLQKTFWSLFNIIGHTGPKEHRLLHAEERAYLYSKFSKLLSCHSVVVRFTALHTVPSGINRHATVTMQTYRTQTKCTLDQKNRTVLFFFFA